MSKFIYIIIVLLCFLAPVKRLDVVKLQPVQVVAIHKDGNDIVITTDTNCQGRGTDIVNAYRDLERTTPGVIYLDTAEYLLITQDSVGYIQELQQYLRPSVEIAIWNGNGDVNVAGKYLSTRGGLVKMRDWESLGIGYK